MVRSVYQDGDDECCWLRGTRFVAVAFGLMLLLVTGCAGPQEPVPLEEGVLDLRGERLTDVLNLRGEWLARAGADSTQFAAFEYDDSHWTPVSVPAHFEQQGFSDEGLVWYRLHLRLRAGTPPLRGFIPYAKNAHTLYAARPGEAPEEVVMSGRPALSAAETMRSRTPATFQLPSDTALVLSWKVANHDYIGGGPFNALVIGPAETIDRMLLLKTIGVSVAFALYVLIGLFFLSSWFWSHRDAPALALGLLALLMAIRTTTLAGAWETLFPAAFGFEERVFLESFSFLALPGLFAYMLWTFLPNLFAPLHLGRFTFTPPTLPGTTTSDTRPPDPISLGVARANTVGAGFAMLMSIVTVPLLLISPQFTSEVLSVARWVSLGMLVCAAMLVVQGLLQRAPLGRMLAIGLLPVLAAAAYDLVRHIGLYHGTSYLSVALLAFVLLQSVAVLRRNTQLANIAMRNTEGLKAEINHQTKELRAATIAAQAANLAKSRFLSAVSHELRTPLTSITGYAQVLTEELDTTLEPHQREFFLTIQNSGHRLLTLINDLLDIAKIESGHLDVPLSSIAVAPLIESTVPQIYPLAREKDLAVRVDVPDDVYVHANNERLQQVLINLLSNAIKFTDTGHVGLRVFDGMFNDSPACGIAVYDTGSGITPEFQPQLFDLFTQEQKSYENTQRGTGLGLAICRDLVHRMRGTISVESKPGEGSTFTVYLHYGEPADEETTGPAPNGSVPASRFSPNLPSSVA